ncbi:MAG: DUF2752 domain-containing protein [Salinibacter sp.]
MSTIRDTGGSLVQGLRAVPLEAVFWTTALVAAASIDPQASGGINLCLLERLGLPCPGDGLGTAIAHLARGHWTASWQAHPLAGPVVGVLVYHIGTLCRTAARGPR